MQNSVKRFLALALALVMVFGMMPQITLGASAAEDTKTVYFQNNWLWTEVRYYYWNDGENIWPGNAMEFVENDGNYDIYKAEIPANANVIFNGLKDDGSGNRDQTPDITDVQTGVCYYMMWDNGNKVGNFPYAPSEGGDSGEEETTHTYTVAGSEELCGTEWDVANTANDMTDEDADGIYTKVYENVAAGAYEYKVAVDHSWNESYGNGTANATVTVAKGGSTVTITFNAETKAVNAEVEVPHEHSYLYDCSTECSTCTNGHREASHAFVAGVCTYGCGTADPDYVAPGTNVAQIGEQGYETLTEAIAAATAGDTIILLADITEDVTVSKNLTIDGAGKTYTGKMNLTASTTIKNVNFDGKGYNGYAVETRSAAKVVIEDCTAKSYGYGFLQVVSNNDTVTVKNVTVSGCNYGVKVDRSNGVTLENVKLDCAVAGLLNSNYSSKTITIKNSEISILGTWTRNDTTKTTYIFEGENTVKTFDINAELDTFKLADVNSTLTAPNEITVTTDVADHEVVYEEGTYKVAPVPKVAQIGETQYKTLTEAIAAATAGDTITLLADVTEDVTVDKNLTIDGAGKTYTGGISVTAGKFTVKNVNFVGGTANYAVTTNRITSVTVENCTVKGYNYGFLYANKSTPTVVVKNVTVEDCNYGVHYVYGSNATLENVTMTNVETGLYVQNYAAKTITVKNCTLGAIDVWVRDGYSAVQTFKFEGTNTATTLDSECAKYVLTAVDATLTAPEGATVTTTVADHEVVYEEGTYKVAPVPKVAQIGETQYKTLTEAIAAADVGDTITLLADITETVKIEKDLTIDGANFQYTGLIEVTGSKVDAVIKNVNFVDGSQYAVKTNTISSITIEDCTVKGYTYGMLYANKSTSTIVVKNVTVEGGEYGLAWNYGSKATLENVTVTGTKYGVITRNYGAKTITLKNCSIDAEYGILVDAKGSKTDTFTFVGVNKVSALPTSSYAKIVAQAQSGEYIGDLVPVVGAVAADATVTLLSNVALTEGVTVDKNLTVDLQGYAVESAGDAFVVTGGTLTLNGDGEVKAGTAGVGSWTAIWANGGHVVINGGTYSVGGDSDPATDPTHQNDVIYTKNGGKVDIYGGMFLNDGTVWTLNENDSHRGTITVYGGTFQNWNPADNVSEGEHTNFVADGYEAVQVEGTESDWTVQKKAEHSLKSYGKSLLFEDIIRVRYYFEYEGDYTAEYIEKNGGILVWTTEHETFTPGTESYKVEGLTKSNRYYYATGKGIPAKQWGDLQYACAYVKNPDGSITYSEVSPYSPETYAYNMLGKDNTKDSLKDLLVTMLNYGAAAQNNFKYDTENLVNAGLSAEQQAWVWDASKLVTKIEVEGSKVGITKAEGVNYYGWSLVYEGAINMKMYNSIDAALVSNASEMGIIYWNEGTYNSVDQLTPDNIDGSVKEMTQASNYYTAIIEGVAAKDLGDTYFACAYVIDNEGNTHYGEVRSYSAHTYANNTINGNKAEELKNLCKTMVIYSDAAKAHFG